MAELNFITMAGGLLRPADEEATEAIKKWGIGNLIIGNFKRPRNYKFLQKFFVMVRYGYDCWEPKVEDYHGMPVQKNFDRFREDCIIAAGYWEPVVNIKGDTRAVAKSISFGAMEEFEFDKLYNDVQKVILENILVNYSKDDYDEVVYKLMGFL